MKWDAFINRKGGMNNTLAPLKTSTNANDASSHNELTRPPKLDAIPRGKREEQSKSDDRPPSPAPGQHRDRKLPDHSQPSKSDHHEKQKSDDRLQSPTSDQQQHHRHEANDHDHPHRHHKTDDHDHHHEAHDKDQDRHHHGLDDDRHHETHDPQERHHEAHDHQHVKDDETRRKDLLKGKPIIFVGGGPGMHKTYSLSKN